MKTTQKLILIIALLAWTFSMAQTYKDPGLINGSKHIDFRDLMSQPNFKKSNNVSKQSNNYQYALSNKVYIEQIGNDNAALVVTRTEESAINIAQHGNDNNVFFQASSSSIETSLRQNGNDNSIYYSNPFTMENHQSQIIQQGSYQNIEWYGGNSISEKMEVSMKGNSQSIIIRSYN